MSSNINPHIIKYMEMVETCEITTCIEQKLLVKLIRKIFKEEELYTDDDQLEKYLGLQKYFPFNLFEWEIFILALHCSTYRKKDNMPRFPDLLLVSGRGTGKDGLIAFVSFCMMSEHNGIKNYDVDICAINEDQAQRPFEDVIGVLEDPKQTKKLKRFFYWNKEEITNLRTKSKLKYRTNNPKGKDSLRTGYIIFNEIHGYEDYKNINVFTTGLGKKKHPRRAFLTTDGDVRGGPLDDYKTKANQILNGEIPDNGLLPFICKLDNKKEVKQKKNWHKANPSLRYLPDLQEEMEKEYSDYINNPSQFSAFMTKRMNIPDGNKEIEVTSWENILATNKDIPDLSGMSCFAGIDYTKITDFASAGLWFKVGELRYWITHSWVCSRSKDLPRIKYPIYEAEKEGLLTIVDDVEVNPDLITAWISEQATKYNIKTIVLDNFRYALLSNSLKKIGFDAKENKNVKLIRPSDIMKVHPVIDSLFANQNIIWGDNSLMRWYTNNTKSIPVGVRGNQKNELGNFVYGKIEAKSRKTDGFMAMIAAATEDSNLIGYSNDIPDVGVYTY